MRTQETGDRSQEAGRAAATSFQDLDVWKKAHALVLDIYRLTKRFPDHERYGLTSQIRRAAVSVPANIAEGFRKTGHMEKARFFNVAQGSLEEVRYYLILATDLQYSDGNALLDKLDEVGKMLHAYVNTLRKRHARS